MSGAQVGEPPDPSPGSTPAELAGQLRALRSWAGLPSLRRLRQLGGTRPAVDGQGAVDALPESTTSYVLRGDRPANAEFVRTFVAACLRARERRPEEIAAQVERWHEAWLAATGIADPAATHPRTSTDPAPAHPQTGTGPGGRVPRQLPADVAGFTGRARELAVLAGLAPAGPPPPGTVPVAVAVVSGTAGVGKTALAVHAAHRTADRFPDGQLFLDLHGFSAATAPVAPQDALDRLLRALGVPGERIPAELDDRAGLWRTVLAGRRMLILLDNAATEAQVAPLLPGTPGCLVLVTSRRRLAGLEPVLPVSLDALPVADALTMFAHAAGSAAASPPGQLVAEAVELCGRLPLAVRIAAARLRAHPSWRLADLVARLRDQDRRLTELTDETGPRSVAAALALSYQQLSADEQLLYHRLGLHPGPDIDSYAAAALLDGSADQAHRLLDQLLDAHLLQEPIPGRYAFHDLVRAHAAAVGEAGGVRGGRRRRRRAAVTRLLDFYRYAAAAAMDAAYPYEPDHRPPVPAARTPIPDLSDPDRAADWLDTELPNLLAATGCAAGAGRPAHAWQLPAILHRHLRTRTRHRDAEALHRRALTAARSSGHRVGERLALVGLGWTCLLQSRYQEAEDCFGQGLAIALAPTGSPAELYAQLGLGRVYWQRGEYDQAQDTYQRVLTVARSTGDRTSELWGLGGLGLVHLMRGRYGPALDCYQRALAIARTTGNRTGETNALLDLGELHRLLGRHASAAGFYQQGLEVALAVGDRDGELSALVGLGHIHRLQDRHPQAIEAYGRARELARGCGDRTGELSALLGIGWVHRRQARYEPAADCYQQVLDLASEIGERNWQFEALEGLGRVHRLAGRPETAVTHHQRALRIATGLAQPADQARAHDGLAHAYRAMHQPGQARQHWRHALDILRQLGTDHTEDEEVTAPAIRAHLASLDQDGVPVSGG